MNNSISNANTPTLKPAEAAVITGEHLTKNTAIGEETATSVKSFQQSIKKAYEDSKTNTELKNNKTTLSSDSEVDNKSGKQLPLSDENTELTAEIDVTTETEPATLSAGLYLSEQLPTEDGQEILDLNAETLPPLTPSQINKTDVDQAEIDDIDLLATPMPATSAVIATNTAMQTNADGKLDEASSQLRQLLGTDKTTSTNKTASNNTASINTSDNSALQMTETAAVKADAAMTALSEKMSLLPSNTAGQQQLLASIQTSLLQQNATALVDKTPSEKATDALAQINGTPINSFSPNNLQTTPPAQLAITESFAKPAWQQAMGKQVMMMVNQNISTAEIRLNPSNLGPIEILIDMSKEQVAVSMTSRHAIVREAMEQALPKLREMLEQNGFALSDSDISKHSFAEQREQNSNNGNNEFSSNTLDQSNMSIVGDQVLKQVAASTSVVDYYI